MVKTNKNNKKNILKSGFKIKSNMKGGKMPNYQDLGLNKHIVNNFYNKIIGLGENFKKYIDDNTWDNLTIPDKYFLEYFKKNLKKNADDLDLFALNKAYIELGYKNINRFLNCKALDVDELLNDKKIAYSNSNRTKKIKEYELKNIYYDGSYVKNQYFENKIGTDKIYREYIGKDLDVFKYVYIPMANFSNENQFKNIIEYLNIIQNQYQNQYQNINIDNVNNINISFNLPNLPNLTKNDDLEYCKYNISSLLHWNSYNPLDQAILSPDLFADGIFSILNHENQQNKDNTKQGIHESIAKMSGYLLEEKFSSNPIPKFNIENYELQDIEDIYKFKFCLCKSDMYDYNSSVNKIFDINWYSYDSFGFMKFIAFNGNIPATGGPGPGLNQSIINANNIEVYTNNIKETDLEYKEDKRNDLFPLENRINKNNFKNKNKENERKQRGLLFLVNNIKNKSNIDDFYNPIQNTSFAYDTDISFDNYTSGIVAIGNGDAAKIPAGSPGKGKAGTAINTNFQQNNEWIQKRSLRKLHFTGEPTQIFTVKNKNTIQRNLPYRGGGVDGNKSKKIQKGGYITSQNINFDESNKMYFTGEHLFEFNGNDEQQRGQQILQNKNHEFLRNIFKIQNELITNKREKIENLDEIKLLAAVHIGGINGLESENIQLSVNKLTRYFKIFSYFDFISKLFSHYLTLYITFIKKRLSVDKKNRLNEKLNKLEEFKKFNFLLGEKVPHQEIKIQQEKYAFGGQRPSNDPWTNIQTIRDVNNLLFYFNIDLSHSVFLNEEQKARYKNAVDKCKKNIDKVNINTVANLNTEIGKITDPVEKQKKAKEFGEFDFDEEAKIITNTYQIVFQGALDYLVKNQLRLLEGKENDWATQENVDKTFIIGNEIKIKQNIMIIIISLEQLYRDKVDNDFSLSGVNLFMSDDKYKTVINSIFLWFIHERGSLNKLNKELNIEYDKALESTTIKENIPQEELLRIQNILVNYKEKNINELSKILFKEIDIYLFNYFKTRIKEYLELKDKVYKINNELSNSTNCNRDDIIENLRENIEELLRVYGGRNSLVSKSLTEYYKWQNLLNKTGEFWIEYCKSLNKNSKLNKFINDFMPIFFTELINRKNLLVYYGSKLDRIGINISRSKTGLIFYDIETNEDIEKLKVLLNKPNEKIVIDNKVFNNLYEFSYNKLNNKLYFNPEIYEEKYWKNLITYFQTQKINNIWYPLVIRVDSDNSYIGNKTPIRFFLVNLLKWAERGEIRNAYILEKEKKPFYKFDKWIYKNYQNKEIQKNTEITIDNYELIEWVPETYRKGIENERNIHIEIIKYFNLDGNRLLCMDIDNIEIKKTGIFSKKLVYDKLMVGFDFIFKPSNKNKIYEYFQFEPITKGNIINLNRKYEIKEFIYKILFNYSTLERQLKEQLNYENGFINFNNKNFQDYLKNVNNITSYMTFNLYTNNQIIIKRIIQNMRLSIVDEILDLPNYIRTHGTSSSHSAILSSKTIKNLYYNKISESL
jgi:hypothetical protein